MSERALHLSSRYVHRFPFVVSKCDLDRSFGRVDAGADHLALAAVDLSGAQIAHLPSAKLADAGVADAHPTAEGKRRAGPLAANQDRRAAVAASLDPALGEAHGASLALAGLAADHRLEALHVQQLAVAVPLPVTAHRVEHLGRAREEGVALAPVWAERVEFARDNPALPASDPQVEVVAPLRALDLPQSTGEDHLVLLTSGVDVDDVANGAVATEAAQHAHDRRDPAAGADEE